MTSRSTILIKFKDVPYEFVYDRIEKEWVEVPMTLQDFCELTRTIARLYGLTVAKRTFTKYVELGKI